MRLCLRFGPKRAGKVSENGREGRLWIDIIGNQPADRYTSFGNSWMLDDHGRNRKAYDRRFRNYSRCGVFVDFRVEE